MPRTFWPVLRLRGLVDGRVRLGAPAGDPAATPAPEPSAEAGPAGQTGPYPRGGCRVMRVDLDLPAGGSVARHEVNGRKIGTWTRSGADRRMVLAAGKGQEHGDVDRPGPERTAMRVRMAAGQLRTRRASAARRRPDPGRRVRQSRPTRHPVPPLLSGAARPHRPVATALSRHRPRRCLQPHRQALDLPLRRQGRVRPSVRRDDDRLRHRGRA